MEKPSLKLTALSTDPDGSHPVQLEPQKSRYDILSGGESFFKSVQWSADGTTLFTSSSSNRITTYVLPSTLLTPRPSPLPLLPTSTLLLGESTSAIAPCPYFALDHPPTQALLTAASDHPIHLHHAFPPSTSPQLPPLSSFRLIKHETEAYLPVASLLWPSPGTHFLAGTTNRVALFDVAALRPDPVLAIATIPSTRHISKGHGVGMRGTVAALAVQPDPAGLIAAGTWTRHLALYDLQRAGTCVATWGVAAAAAEAGVGGRGVVQTVWSPCGRYLVVNERGAGGLLVYDLRGANRLVAWLVGREGDTNQRLSCDVFPGTEAVGGFEVWAGTKDGGVVVWEGVGMKEGAVPPSWEWEAHGSAVGSVAMHASGSVLATCSGSWMIKEEEGGTSSSGSDGSGSDESSSSSRSSSSGRVGYKSPFVVEETSLKVWSIGAGNAPERDRTPEKEDTERRSDICYRPSTS
ncbi:WD40-repeat-containing domain protein [Schizothecium vesticola]|uniref:WD40-repeat-containing domain protein n=1 Tax=Schizothecium vesticola TaxID=314040 RepID=A0AA40K2N8_9PEZI|nr:WD40-repeat-containing domain protein [Schizothecium vesticola]